MTTPTVAAEVAERKRQGATLYEDTLAEWAAALMVRDDGNVERYRDDPAAYCSDILGFYPWSKQAEALQLCCEHPRVAISSGHKVGKSTLVSALAFHEYHCWDRSRVILTAPSSHQVNDIVFREVRRLWQNSGKCAECALDVNMQRPCPHSMVIPGEIHELAHSGVKDTNRWSEIIGVTASSTEAFAGISSPRVRYIVDEASGVDEAIFAAIRGNSAADGTRTVMISNPTKPLNEGEFAKAFGDNHTLWKTLEISSTETPNFVQGREVIPGLAGRAHEERYRLEFGVEHPEYYIRVLGKHCDVQSGRMNSLAAIKAAEDRWTTTPGEGVLEIGVDVAGESGAGDEAVFVAVRGRRMLDLHAVRGLEPAGYVGAILAFVEDLLQPGEVPVVKVDAEGFNGYKTAIGLMAYAEQHPERMVVVPVKASDHLRNDPWRMQTVRDELHRDLSVWLKDGAILRDGKLAKELNAPSWQESADGRHMKATPKREIRKLIGRSPDRFDALALAVRRRGWEQRLSCVEAQPIPSGNDEINPWKSLDDLGL